MCPLVFCHPRYNFFSQIRWNEVMQNPDVWRSAALNQKFKADLLPYFKQTNGHRLSVPHCTQCWFSIPNPNQETSQMEEVSHCIGISISGTGHHFGEKFTNTR